MVVIKTAVAGWLHLQGLNVLLVEGWVRSFMPAIAMQENAL